MRLHDAFVFVLESNEQVTDLRKHLQAFVFHEDADEVLLFGGQVTRNPQHELIELLGGEKTYIPKRPGEPDCTWADISRRPAVIEVSDPESAVHCSAATVPGGVTEARS